MNRKFLKNFLPKRLLPRLLMIFLIPLIIIQCSVIFFFYDRHWEKIINRFSNIASNKINLIIKTYEKENIQKTRNFASDLNISLFVHKEIPKILQRRSILEEKVYKTIRSRVNKNIDVHFKEEFVAFYMKFENEVRSPCCAAHPRSTRPYSQPAGSIEERTYSRAHLALAVISQIGATCW